MVKHTLTTSRQQTTNCLSVFDHFVELGLKGLINFTKKSNCVLNAHLKLSHLPGNVLFLPSLLLLVPSIFSSKQESIKKEPEATVLRSSGNNCSRTFNKKPCKYPWRSVILFGLMT